MINCRLYDIFRCTGGLGSVALFHIMVVPVTRIFFFQRSIIMKFRDFFQFFQENSSVVRSVRPRQPCCVSVY
jgi:hypothetical protein